MNVALKDIGLEGDGRGEGEGESKFAEYINGRRTTLGRRTIQNPSSPTHAESARACLQLA